ncbi:zinc finger protein 26-like [Aricia agestis]|uniref:zinc finger protein 26-like n=1 Tax=Aricia agestis TaxID=91739 RepID=UPI001C206EA4|nr:zinc finger protein 26-like [Aricia agestis]XP_041985859.1 zinc finger protein 26-like [Aricia agestis]
MEVMNESIDLKLEPDVIDTRQDPTSFLPDEPMSYEIKPKKKKKKKKQVDPFKDIEEKVKLPTPTVYEPVSDDLLTECVPATEVVLPTETGYEPGIAIKVENIEVEVDYNDFANDSMPEDPQGEENEQVEVKLEQQNDGLHPIFDQILGNTKKMIEENTSAENFVCDICHLVFRMERTLRVHQRRKHKLFKKAFKHSCDDCGMSYEVKNSLIAHIRRKHGPNAEKDDNEEQTCDLCALVFKGVTRLRMHMRRKHGSFEDSFEHACKYCGLTYDKYRSLTVHIKRKHSKVKKPENQWFSCPFCPKVYTKRETYARHVQRHHTINESNNQDLLLNAIVDENTGEFTCTECRLVFSTLNSLKLHMRRKHNAFKENFRLKCKICGLSYDKKESLKRHIRRKHDQGAYCEVCNKQFVNREQYLNHSHERPMVNQCHLCNFIFASQGGLAKHLRCTHNLQSPKKFFCSTCNEGFYDKRQLKPHFLKVHLKASYTCRYCNKIFKARESFKRHVRYQHPVKEECSLNGQKCEQCSEVFVDELELCRHVNLAHCKGDDNLAKAQVKTEEMEKQVHQCPKCSESFEIFEDLRAHYNKSHQIVEETQCQMCGEMVLSNELQKHIKASHDEMLTCQYCDYETNNKTSMTQHLLRHKNAKTLTCDFPNCKYNSYYESAMKKHKAKHSEQGVKFQCTQCPFQTMNKYILRYHEEAHVTGKKRYMCDQCDYATILPANLVQHKYKHSPEKRFRCEFCPFATKYNTSLRFHVKKKHCDLPN